MSALLYAVFMFGVFWAAEAVCVDVTNGSTVSAAETVSGQETQSLNPDSVLYSAVLEYQNERLAAITTGTVQTDTLGLLAEAFAMVESTQNPKAYNKSSGAAGYLQFKPIMVDEANRLRNREKHTVGVRYYNHDDRWDREKSIEMFKVVMRNRNCGLSVRRACQLWNCTHTELYYQTVKRNFERLLAEAAA